ncbi:MAG: Crp/Fnr family transcriptional regulator [Sphingobacteriales bacterium]|nr:Crp/Fnr family transcriptional regulator [Sphingobacteriales bacterium]
MAALKSDCLTCKTKNCSLLKDCDKNTLNTINTVKLTKSLKKGEKLFCEGDPVQGVYFIKKGFLKVELNGKHGRPLILQITGQGSVFGHRATPIHPYHPSTVTAASDTQYCYIRASIFHGIVEKSPDLKKQIINQFLNEIELAEKKSVILAHKTVREKIAEALLIFARVYGYENKRRSFSIHFCRQDIADLTGTTKEQVSKTLNDFEKEKLVKCSAKKFTYIDINSLLLISSLYP